MEEYDEMDEFMENLFHSISRLPEPVMRIINPTRYREMIVAAEEVQELLRKEFVKAKPRIKLYMGLNIGQIILEVPEFTVSDISTFQKILSKAEDIVFFPKANGNIRIEISFRGVLVPFYKEEEGTKLGNE